MVEGGTVTDVVVLAVLLHRSIDPKVESLKIQLIVHHGDHRRGGDEGVHHHHRCCNVVAGFGVVVAPSTTASSPPPLAWHGNDVGL